MKIKGKLVFECEETFEVASIIARSLAPDNLPEIKTEINDDRITVFFSGDKIGTVLSTVEDYLMNAIIAQKLSYFIFIKISK